MKIQWSPLQGLCVIESNRIEDDRGFFSECYNHRDFAAQGLDAVFVQDNHSRSYPGVLRGLHYQFSPAQTKLVSVSVGRIWDVAVDIRQGSHTYGRWFGAELSANNGRSMWIPAGFAHGFVVLGDQCADVHYKSSSHYHPGAEGGIAHDDAQLGIPWPISSPILSERDRNLQKFSEYTNSPRFDVAHASVVRRRYDVSVSVL